MSYLAHAYLKEGRKLPRSFYTRADVLRVARELLGKRLIARAPDGARVGGLIVETEAYMAPEDKASHAYNNRRTPRTEMMFAEGGVAYVYLIYGIHKQFNVVTNREGAPHAVLIRALEPAEGLEWMRKRRGVEDVLKLTSGPGKLCQALGVERDYNGEDLSGERVWIEDVGLNVRRAHIATGPRIGIHYAAEYAVKPWRFMVKNNPFVSVKR